MTAYDFQSKVGRWLSALQDRVRLEILQIETVPFKGRI